MVDFTNLKPYVEKLDIDKLKKVPTNLCNLKSNVDKLDIDKLVVFPVDFSKLSDVIKNNVVKKMLSKVKNEIPIITNLATTTALNAKINEVKKKNT